MPEFPKLYRVGVVLKEPIPDRIVMYAIAVSPENAKKAIQYLIDSNPTLVRNEDFELDYPHYLAEWLLATGPNISIRILSEEKEKNHAEKKS